MFDNPSPFQRLREAVALEIDATGPIDEREAELMGSNAMISIVELFSRDLNSIAVSLERIASRTPEPFISTVGGI